MERILENRFDFSTSPRARGETSTVFIHKELNDQVDVSDLSLCLFGCGQKSFREKKPGPFAVVYLRGAAVLRNMLGNSRKGNDRRLSFSEAVLLKVQHRW